MCPHVVDKKPLPYFSRYMGNFYCALQQYASWMLNDSPKQQKTNSHKDIASLKKSPVVGVCPFDPGWVHVQTRVCVCVCVLCCLLWWINVFILHQTIYITTCFCECQSTWKELEYNLSKFGYLPAGKLSCSWSWMSCQSPDVDSLQWSVTLDSSACR